MKKLFTSLKFLLVAVCLLGGGNSAWAQDPTPVYFNDFSSTDGLTIIGSGEFTTDDDAHFGQIYQNDPSNSNSVRTNYLVLPSNVLSHSATSLEMTIGFWVNQKKEDTNNLYYPLFAAYKEAPNTTSNENGMPMFVCQSRGLLQYNNESQGGTGSWCNFENAQNIAGTNAENNSWCFDGKWHYYTVTLTETSAKVYVDGSVVNSWTLDNSTAGQKLTALLTNTTLQYITLGGNQAWGWGDPDPAFGFDDFAVYDVALTPAQIEKIIDTKKGRTTIYNKTLTGETAWTSSDAAASGTDLNVWYGNMGYSDTYGIYGSANGNRSSVMTFSHTANSIQTFDIVFNNLGNTGDGGNYSYIKIGSDIEIQSNQQNQNGAVIINGSSTAITDCNVKNYNRGGDSWTIHVEINTAEKKVTAFTLVGSAINGKSAHYTMASETALSSSATFNTVTIGFVRVKGTPATALTSIKIKEQAQTVTNVNYTINYKLGENLVKSVAGEGVVDQVIAADAAIDGTEAGYEGNHYLITAAEAPSMTLINGANVLDVPVRAPYTATLTLTKNIGGEAQTPEVTNLTETDAKVCSWIYAYPMYMKKGDVYYIADVTSSFGESGSFTDGQSISKTVNYTVATPEVVWFKDIDGASVSDVAYSGGGYTNTNVELANVTVNAGIYEVIFNVVSKAGSGSNHRNEGVSVNGENVANLTGNVNGLRSLMINVSSEESVITAYGNGTSSYTDNLDYVIIKKLPATVSATIATSGYSTIASEYALDCAKLPSGLKAYKVTGATKTAVNLEEVSEAVQAGTGLILEGAPSDTYSIPVAVSGTDISSTNKLKAAVTATAVAANEAYILQGGEFHLVTEASTVPAGKAYLLATDVPAGVRALDMVVDGNADGITAIDNAQSTGNTMFDLSGRRVAKAQKGIYIVNGKKVVK